MAPRVHIVADDLTGALDSAAPFAARGASVRVACTAQGLAAALASGAEVVAVATGTRDGDAATAARAARSIAQTLHGHPGLLFKKIDSRLKGHIAAEIDALVPPGAALLVNPAIPRLGRFCVDGAVIGAGVGQPLPVAPRIGRAITVPDTRTQADLVAALPRSLTGTTFIGAAGLGEALAARLFHGQARPARPPMPALLAAGSRDPVTLEQLDRLSLPAVDCPNGTCPAPAPTLTQTPLALLRMTQGRASVCAPAASAAFADSVARCCAAQHTATLFVCGGESAAAVLARLGIDQLDLCGEALAGVPIARSADARPLTVITKSGGFGAPDTLVKLVKFLSTG